MRLKVAHALAIPALIGAALVATIAPASASDAPSTDTVISTGYQEPYPTDFPCLPPGGMLSWHYRDVFHITDFGTGVYHFADTFYGDATFVAADGTPYTGKVVSHMSIQSNKSPTQYTFTIALRFTLKAADGETVSFNSVVHSVGTATGREDFFELNHC